MIALPRNLKHLWLAFALFPLSTQADTVRIYVTNSAGDSVHVIDAATNKVVQVFKGPEAMHGIGFAPDGSRVYVSSRITIDARCVRSQERQADKAGAAEQPAEQYFRGEGWPDRSRHRPR